MSRSMKTFWVAITCCQLLITGCQPAQPLYLFEDGDMSYYKDVAQDIEYPDVESQRLADVDGALPPLTLDNPNPTEFWDLSLEEAVQSALHNSKVMRTIGGTVLREPNGLRRFPDAAQTVYDPALVESNPRQGIEAALSAFDARFSTSVFWERNERPVNVAGGFAQFVAPSLQQDLGSFQAQLSKTTATGGTFALQNLTNYDYNNNPSNLFPSSWTTSIAATFRQPLLQGAGVEFNRIAGPGAQPGFNIFNVGTGVVLARINTDIALTEFEVGVRELVFETEQAYWELYFAYRDLDTKKKARDTALRTWRRVYALYQQGSRGGSAAEEGQAREQYYLFQQQVENALNTLYATERKLRFMIGIAPTDGRLIRPADEPTIAKVLFDYHDVQCEALVRAVEIRRQKWRVKQRELELIASRNFLLPQLDAVGRYRWFGFGNDLIDPNSGGKPPFDNAWQSLLSGDYQEWQLGLEMGWTLGLRQQHAGVRYAQMQLVRERAVLSEQELEITTALQGALGEVSRAYNLSETIFSRRAAAEDQLDALEAVYEKEHNILNQVLDAQRRLADAESQFFRAVVDYNLGIATVHYTKSSLLEYNNVYLAEGPWPGKAYFDARRRARERDGAMEINYGFTQPNVISRGVYPQMQGPQVEAGQYIESGPLTPLPQGAEQLPTPAPTPADTPPSSGVPSGGAPSGAPRASGQFDRSYGAVNLGPRGGNVNWGSHAMPQPTSSQAVSSRAPADNVQLAGHTTAALQHENLAHQTAPANYPSAAESQRRHP
ncbi:MAG: TolC family protein [Planctomycetales bacterium]|nr:TolC family protein [Planctomycetales bacterium]